MPNVDELAAWSAWVPFERAVIEAPTSPGVYLAREGANGAIVYVGMAGERRGSGIRGRLTAYASGRGLVSGLGEAVLDRALADPDWVRDRLDEVQQGRPARAKVWARMAIDRASLHMRWAEALDPHAARDLELAVLGALTGVPLWNRLR